MKNFEDPENIASWGKNSIPKEIEDKAPYAEVQRVVQSLKLENLENFEYNGRTHQLLSASDGYGRPIEYFASTELDGCDIYIWDSLMEKDLDFLRVALAHELAEISIDDILGHERKEEAHQLALLYEARYKMENLTDGKIQQFETFSKELREKEYEE